MLIIIFVFVSFRENIWILFRQKNLSDIKHFFLFVFVYFSVAFALQSKMTSQHFFDLLFIKNLPKNERSQFCANMFL